MADSEAITSLSEVSDASTFVFRVRDTDDVREAILVRDTGTDGEIMCWLNYCQHFTHIKLDKGSGAPMRDGEIICANHGAYFEATSGECTFGPCEGAYLTALDVTVTDGEIYLTDDEYAFVGPGPIDDGDDRTSTSNVEF